MFTLTIKTDNAAFGDEPSYEVGRILLEVAEKVGAGHTRGTVRDENGNMVGSFKLTKRGTVKPREWLGRAGKVAP